MRLCGGKDYQLDLVLTCKHLKLFLKSLYSTVCRLFSTASWTVACSILYNHCL